MTAISVVGAGAFGTALAISLAQGGRRVSLIARNREKAAELDDARENRLRLAGFPFPKNLRVTADTGQLAPTCLLVVPTQSLHGTVAKMANVLEGRAVVACCKGVDLASGFGPTGVISAACPKARTAILSGPSFAVDIAAGLPTALTLASQGDGTAKSLQKQLSTGTLRIYTTSDVSGVEMGGALKNVMAIAAGVTIGAGLGESARAALMTRGFAEMVRFATAFGAATDTLSGLSGFGDMVLTCTSEKSRNYRYGLSLGADKEMDDGVTVEGVTTAKAVARIASQRSLDLPITFAVARLLSGDITVREAAEALLSRPMKEE